MAVVLDAPGRLRLDRLPLTPPGDTDVVVAIDFSGISTGTERLLWSGSMPAFPGMGYPLVPGYESVGRITEAGIGSKMRAGDHVFVPGARCFGDVRGLFGGAAARLVVPGARVMSIGGDLGERGVLLALAATARHAMSGHASPDLIIGHGTLGRLLARLAVLAGGPPPVVWERNADRADGAAGYVVRDPLDDDRKDYRAIYDASGDSDVLDLLLPHLAPGGEIVLAGFYKERLSFAFPPAFMREARIRVAAEWQQSDLVDARDLVADGRLSLDGLITHRRDAGSAQSAYATAFDDPGCLKMVLDWRACS